MWTLITTYGWTVTEVFATEAEALTAYDRAVLRVGGRRAAVTAPNGTRWI